MLLLCSVTAFAQEDKGIGQIVAESYSGYFNYLWGEITLSNGNPIYANYFYMLLFITLLVLTIEWLAPWRKEQPKFRRDFWLDTFYMFFNFFLFSLIGFYALSNVVVDLLQDGFRALGINHLDVINLQTLLPFWAYVVVAFLLRDFIQWSIHRLLHRVPFLWEFHKVHHSVAQMGVAAHLRYHWMENVVYKSLEYFPLALLGVDLGTFMALHLFALTVGHFNHSNINIPLGPLKYLLNNPQMHIWHHAKEIPPQYRYGINFGITLSLWDYLFGTACMPHNGRDITLGFEGDEHFPQTFAGQLVQGFGGEK